MLDRRGQRIDDDREFFMATLTDIGQVFAELLSLQSMSSSTSGEAETPEDVLANAKVYHHGHGATAPDMKRALGLYEIAAQSGSIEAAQILHKIYFTGSGGRKSIEKALYYRRRVDELSAKLGFEERWEAYLGRSDNNTRQILDQEQYETALYQAAQANDVTAIELIIFKIANSRNSADFFEDEVDYDIKNETTDTMDNMEFIDDEDIKPVDLDPDVIDIMIELAVLLNKNPLDNKFSLDWFNNTAIPQIPINKISNKILSCADSIGNADKDYIKLMYFEKYQILANFICIIDAHRQIGIQCSALMRPSIHQFSLFIPSRGTGLYALKGWITENLISIK